jgi:hypothetical protein
VERAPILADGTLGTFVEEGELPADHYSHTAVLTGPWIHLVGGNRAAIARLPVGADGRPGKAEEAAVSLPDVSYRASVVRAAGRVHAIGGQEHPRRILSAPVTASGELGAFTETGRLPGHGRYSHWSVVLDDGLYLIGGRDSTDAFLATIERAQILPDGSLSPFETVSAELSSPRGYFGGIVAGDDVFVIAGEDPAHLRTVERAVVGRSRRATAPLSGAIRPTSEA